MYHRSFGALLEEPVEIVAIRATMRVALPPRADGVVPGRDAGPCRTMRAYSFNHRAWEDFVLIDRSEISGAVHGPAIVTESTTTTYVDADWIITIGDLGEMRLTSTRQQARQANARPQYDIA